MTLFSKWFAAALISTSLAFVAPSAEAKKKTKAHAKKHVAYKSEPRSPGYARAAEYMKSDRKPASSHKVKKHKKTAKKKARKNRA